VPAAARTGAVGLCGSSGPVPIDRRTEVAVKIEQWRRRAPTSLRHHAALIHRDDRDLRLYAARHHAEWIRVLEDREQFPFVCIVAPPGYGKSTWFSQAYPTWRIGATQGRVRIGLVSSTATQAEGFAGAVQAAVMSPLFQATYGVEPDYDRGWARSAFFCTGTPAGPNPTLTATGIGGPILGRRFDEIILDDPTTWDQARSEQVMMGQRHWLRSTLLKRLPPGMRPPDGKGGRVVAIMTRWSVRDLYDELKTLGFKTLVMPAMGYWDGIHDPESGEVIPGEAPLWPEKESAAALQEMRENDALVFELVMQGNPQVLQGDVFDPAYFQRGLPPLVEDFDRIVAYADTASGKDRKRGDYFAMCTIGIRANEVWILDMERERYPAPEQEKAVVRVAQRFEDLGRLHDVICIEDANEGTALYQRLVVETRLPLRLMPVGDASKKGQPRDKEFRAIPLSNAYSTWRVHHPVGPDGQPPRWVRLFEAELEAFPNGAHDDQVDAATGAFNSSVREASGPRIRILD
jgi:predicted phage terminase large subunit-like protein